MDTRVSAAEHNSSFRVVCLHRHCHSMSVGS